MNDAIEPIDLIKGALTNPGTVSILVSGPSGCGKTYTIENALVELDFKRKSIPAVFAPDSVSKWKELAETLSNEAYRVLVIDHVEDMPQLAQTAMFHAFSNTQGDLMTFPDSKYQIRFVFTTIMEIADLRSNSDVVMPHVYDRISHLIIRMKPLMAMDNTWGRFKEIWKALKFGEHNSLPKEEGGLRQWITSNINKMNGNYRDLEKLAIRWHNRRLLGFDEERILNLINNEYKEIGFGAEPELDAAVFQIPQPNGGTITWVNIEADFKRYLKEWSVKEFGTLSRAATQLGVSVRTLDRWK